MLRIYKPDLKIIICSGYNAELVAERRDKAIGAVYMAKPFTSEALISAVRECIDSAPQKGSLEIPNQN
jgi:CheY-like chemotaxis protein